jgi:hypothetical protein
MSYTFIKDDEWYARQYENRLNEVVRRCRVGKVRPKHAGVWPLGVGKPALPRDTFFNPPYDPIATWIQNGEVMDHPRNCVWRGRGFPVATTVAN